jgi:hypothetical protein
MVKSIMFSIELITDRSKSARAEAETIQLWSNTIHLWGSALGVAVVITRCTLCTPRIVSVDQGIIVAGDRDRGGSGDHHSDGSLASGEWIREQRGFVENPVIRRLETITGMSE